MRTLESGRLVYMKEELPDLIEACQGHDGDWCWKADKRCGWCYLYNEYAIDIGQK